MSFLMDMNFGEFLKCTLYSGFWFFTIAMVINYLKAFVK
jgi:hypothetical protein